MILLLDNLFSMFYTYGLHPNFMVTKYGCDTIPVLYLGLLPQVTFDVATSDTLEVATSVNDDG
jgi:hypothetical protein